MKYVLDEHINPAIVRGLLRANPNLEVVQVSQQFSGMADPELIEWATINGYVLVTRDVNTLVGFAYERIAQGIHTEGVFVLRQDASFGGIITDLLLIAASSERTEWANQVIYIPLSQ